MHPLWVGLDVTPLAGPITGVGRYVQHLVEEFDRRDDVRVVGTAWTLRGRRPLRDRPGVNLARRPAPARLLHQAWGRADLPRGEWLTGRVDVLHGTNFVLPPTRRAGVVTLHDLTYVRYPQLVAPASRRYAELVPRALRRGAHVVTVSRAVADEVAETYRLPPERITVTPLGVDPAWAEPAGPPLPGLPAEYVLAVGTLEPRKGLDVLLAAYRELPAAPPLVLVGAAGWGEALDAAHLDPSRVIRPGYLTDEQVRAAVAHATLLAFPSRYEGFGLPPLEALAAGTPVVASDLPVTREVLGRHASYAPAGDAPALAAALADALAHPPGAADRAAAREYAATFTWSRCADRTVDAYRQALAATT